jgi:hypothetical protein
MMMMIKMMMMMMTMMMSLSRCADGGQRRHDARGRGVPHRQRRHVHRLHRHAEPPAHHRLDALRQQRHQVPPLHGPTGPWMTLTLASS